jgi:asparagine synthase (glutamine-hydrolysing)
MCGLAGLAWLGGRALPPGADDVLRRMSGVVAHRGPDAERVLREASVALAFRRLSLVDPVGGGQPLLSPDGQVALIANGEIYNHAELAAQLPVAMRTQSDCEVLVHLYQRDGIRFLDRVCGMFALIIWDRARDRLIFARDRFGIKPLYFHHNDQRVVFASEIKALFEDPECPRELDWYGALRDETMTLSPHSDPSPPITWFRGVEAVPAATVVSIDLRSGSRTDHRYWTLPASGATLDLSPEEFTTRYRALLAESVSDCMMADCEIGLLLSGGVDSSAVAALAARTAEIPTFSALTATTVVNGDARSARSVARALGLPHHQVVFAADEHPGGQEWRDLLWLLETPLCGPEQYYKFRLHQYARQIRPDLKAMLLGQASDEFNGGYFADFGGDDGWPGVEAALRQLARGRALLAAPELAAWWEGPMFLKDGVVDGPADATDAYALYLRWRYRSLQQYHLWHEDRTAAGNGIEARVPFLDHRLVELACAVPPALRERLLWDKRILRDAVADVLPPETAERTKSPFILGAGAHHTRAAFLRMLAVDGGALVEEALASPGGKDLLDADGVRAALRSLTDNPAAWQFELLLRVVNLGLLDAMCRAVPAPPTTVARETITSVAADHDWPAAVARALGGEATPAACVPQRGPNVTLLDDGEGGAAHYIAVDAVLEYVVDSETDGHWWTVLREMDGIRTLGELVAAAGTSIDAIAGHLSVAQDAGIVRLRAAAGESA